MLVESMIVLIVFDVLIFIASILGAIKAFKEAFEWIRNKLKPPEEKESFTSLEAMKLDGIYQNTVVNNGGVGNGAASSVRVEAIGGAVDEVRDLLRTMRTETVLKSGVKDNCGNSIDDHRLRRVENKLRDIKIILEEVHEDTSDISKMGNAVDKIQKNGKDIFFYLRKFMPAFGQPQQRIAMYPEFTGGRPVYDHRRPRQQRVHIEEDDIEMDTMYDYHEDDDDEEYTGHGRHCHSRDDDNNNNASKRPHRKRNKMRMPLTDSDNDSYSDEE